MPSHTRFKGVASSNESLLSGQLEANLKLFFDWALLGVGAYANITLPASPTGTAGAHRLRLSDDPNYTQGRVWEAFRKDWVWETGVQRTPAPINISGVWTNGTFRSLSSTGTYAHIIDHPNGRIIFTSAIPTGTHVSCEYSYRKYQVYAGDPDWFREVQLEADWNNSQFLQIGSGAWSAMADARVQTPAVVIRPLAGVINHPLELGNLVHQRQQPVSFHVLGDNSQDVCWMHDVLVGQKEKTIRLFDLNEVIRDDEWPLNGAGSRKTDAMMYPDLVAEDNYGGYFYNKCYIKNTISQEKLNRPPLRHTNILWNCEVDTE